VCTVGVVVANAIAISVDTIADCHTHDHTACRADSRSPGNCESWTGGLCSLHGQVGPSDLLTRGPSDGVRQSADACAPQFDRRRTALEGVLGHIRSSSRVFAADPLPPDEHGPSEELGPRTGRYRADSHNA